MLIPLLSFFWLHSAVGGGGGSSVDAHATRDNVGCGFHLSCSGASFNGSVGEKGSGQARASSDVVAPSLFTWFGDAFADQQGSGCWWTRTFVSLVLFHLPVCICIYAAILTCLSISLLCYVG